VSALAQGKRTPPIGQDREHRGNNRIGLGISVPAVPGFSQNDYFPHRAATEQPGRRNFAAAQARSPVKSDGIPNL